MLEGIKFPIMTRRKQHANSLRMLCMIFWKISKLKILKNASKLIDFNEQLGCGESLKTKLW